MTWWQWLISGCIWAGIAYVLFWAAGMVPPHLYRKD